MLAIGNDELGEFLGENIECPHCSQQHKVESSSILNFYNCGDKTYLCGIKGQSIMHKFATKGAE